MAEHVWQDTFPITQAQEIGMAIMAKSFTTALIRDAWIVAEYGVGQLAVTPSAGLRAVPSHAPVSHDEALGQLVEFAHDEANYARDVPDPGSPGARSLHTSAFVLPWATILEAIIAAIIKASTGL